MTRIQLTEWGGPRVLEAVTVPVPEPVRAHLLVRVAAAGVNPIDVTTRKGAGVAAALSGIAHHPVVLGWEVSGTVVATAGDCTGFSVGERVCALVNFPAPAGTYTEYMLIPAYQAARIPQSIGNNTPDGQHLVQLGALPLAGLTAYQALFEVGQLSAGQRVLIHAGAGGVGHLAIQLACEAGAEVFATASERNRDFVASLGATVIDYEKQDFRQALASSIDLVLNSTGSRTFLGSLDTLIAGGRIVTLTSPDPLDKARKRGFTAEWLTVHPSAAQLQHLVSMFAAGRLRVELAQTLPLERAAHAHELIESRHTRGKIALLPSVF